MVPFITTINSRARLGPLFLGWNSQQPLPAWLMVRYHRIGSPVTSGQPYLSFFFLCQTCYEWLLHIKSNSDPGRPKYDIKLPRRKHLSISAGKLSHFLLYRDVALMWSLKTPRERPHLILLTAGPGHIRWKGLWLLRAGMGNCDSVQMLVNYNYDFSPLAVPVRAVESYSSAPLGSC